MCRRLSLVRPFLLLLILFLGFPGLVHAKVSNDPEPLRWAYELLRVPEAWEITTGSDDTVVAVIDNGIDIDHPDLVQNIWTNRREIAQNGLDDDRNGYVDDVYGWNFIPDDLNGDGEIGPDEVGGNPNVRPRLRTNLSAEEHENISHATIVAGIIGARGDNGIHGRGINWRVKLMSVRVVDETGVSESFVLGKAIRYAVDNGADIINVSLVGSAYDTELRSAVEYAAFHGVAMVAAAGNSLFDLNTTPQYPVCADALQNAQTVVGVSAIREGRMFAQFSNSGSSCIDVTAPGVDIASTIANDPAVGFVEAYATGKRGTSYAAPFVSGILALVKSVQPEWQAKELYTALFESVSKTTPKNEDEYAALFGRGLVQAFGAVEKAALTRTAFIPRALAIWRTGQSSFEVHAKNSSLGEEKKIEVFADATQVETIFFRGDLAYISLSRVDSKNARLRLYTSDFTLVSDKRIAAPANAKMAVGFVTRTDAPEIVVYVPNASTWYEVFSLFGVKRLTVPASPGQALKALTIVRNPSASLGEVAAVMADAKGAVVLRLFASNGSVQHTVSLPKVRMPTSLAIGNITGDDALEIVVGHNQGSGPMVSYLTYEGVELRAFPIGEGGAKSTTQVLLADLYGDRYLEVVVKRTDNGKTIRVFDDRPRLLEMWEFPDLPPNSRLEMFTEPLL